MDADEIIELIVPIYTKYFTENEIEELIILFKNPAIVKYFQVSSIISEDTIKVIVKHIEEKAQTLE